MPALSAVVITFNEERAIARCLGSVAPIADDIVVVDSFSTDKTPELCRGFPVNFTQRAWEGYSPAKNFANSLAKNDFVLSIDADEELSPELTESIREVKKGPAAGAYSFNRITNYCGRWIRHGGWYPDVKIRLFDRTRARWEGAIHEQLKGAENAKRLSGDCFHHSYSSVAGHLAQAKKFAALAAEELFKQGRRASSSAAILRLPARFVRDYVFKAGFLDGKNGLLIAAISAYAAYLKYSRLARLCRERNTRP
jgi:(heptosyl)LPS beta-1,4-glucosyltransferase